MISITSITHTVLLLCLRTARANANVVIADLLATAVSWIG